MRKSLISFLAYGAVIVFTFFSCGKDIDGPPAGGSLQVNDNDLFKKANNRTGFMYYKNVTDTLNSAGTSPHQPYIMVRFNEIALNGLGTDGKLPPNGKFADESLIVKEIYKNKGGALDHYAVMMKRPADNNEESGWIWAEYNPNGSVKVSVDDKGSQCVSCHKSQGNRDLVMTFALH